MPKPTTILVSALVMVLIVAVGGCIEQRDPPPEGPFTITMESGIVMYAFEGQATKLHGPHAEVETELHEEHPVYSWSIEGMARQEGSDVHVDGGNVGLRETTYHLDYYEQKANMSMVLATLPDSAVVYMVVAMLPGEAEWNGTPSTELVIEPGGGLEAIHEEDVGSILAVQNWTSDLVVNVSLPSEADAPVTYVVALTNGDDISVEPFEHTLVIHPGLHHHLVYTSTAGLTIAVANLTTPDAPFQEGAYEDLPSSYVAHPGHLEWEGEVGKTDEAPGPGAVIALSALFVAVVVLVRRRQSG